MKRTLLITLTALVVLVPLAAWAGYNAYETSLSVGRLELTVRVPDPSLQVNESANSSIELKNIDSHGIRVLDSQFWALHIRYYHENGTEVRWLYHRWPAVDPRPIRESDLRILEPGQSIKFEVYSLPMEFFGKYHVQVEYHLGDLEEISLSHWKGSVFSNRASFEVGD